MAGFEIDGERFEIPELHTLTLRECRILYTFTKEDGAPITQEDFEHADPDWPEEQKAAHLERRIAIMERPDFKLALAAIAYRRQHPDVNVGAAWEKAESANGLAVTVALILGGDDVDPTRSTSPVSPEPPEIESSTSQLSKTADSGPNSGSDGTEPDTTPATIGISDSDISSRGALPIESGI